MPACGDFTANAAAGESCDAGGVDTAACDADCTAAACGDGDVNALAGETCDAGAQVATCDGDCTAPVCGDGIRNVPAGEECDDGNVAPGDNCDAACATECVTPGALATTLGGINAHHGNFFDVTAVAAIRIESIDAHLPATSNVVEHAYGPEGGDLRVRAELDGDTAVITVSDDGRWRAPRGANRGRGSALMAAASDELTVNRRPDGTDVMIRRRLGKERA